MPTRREIILEELAKWRAEGVITNEQHAAMAARYQTEDALLNEQLDAAVAREERGSFAVAAMQLVGGLLLGAALVALTFYLNLEGASAGWTLLLFGAVGLGAGAAMHFLAEGRESLEEALLAAGFVPLAIAPFPGMEVDVESLIAGPAVLLAIAVYILRRGRGPSALLAGAAFVATSFALVGPEIFESDASPPYLWWALLLGFGGLMLVWREEAWTSAGFGLYVAPLTAAFAMSVAEWGIREETPMQLILGAYLGVFLAIGVLLGIRGLVAGAAAGLTIDAVAFAANLGGPGTAVIVLVVLGGLLVWQAEFLRAYFRRRGRRTPVDAPKP